MKPRLLAALLCAFALIRLIAEVPSASPEQVTTLTRSSVKIGNGSFALVKGTKLDVVARDGDMLIVKYRSSQGKVPVTDTDWPVEPAADDAAPAAAPAAAVVPVKPAASSPTVAKPAMVTPAAKSVPPALNTSGSGHQPATNYGKAVQKAKQVTETQKSTRVDPTRDIMDEEPKK
jgi:hypothetical protein